MLVSPVSAVNMNDKYIAIGYSVGEMHLYDKLSGELLGVLFVSDKQTKIDKILFAKFTCDIQPATNWNCQIDNEVVDVIITISGGIVKVIFEDYGDIEQQKQQPIGDKVLKSYLKFDTSNQCGWDGNCRLLESKINDFVIDED